MFADMADSSALKTKLGDRADVEKVLGAHAAIFLNCLADIPRAQEIKNAGDGFFANFPLVSDAVNLAVQFEHETRIRQLDARLMVDMQIAAVCQLRF